MSNPAHTLTVCYPYFHLIVGYGSLGTATLLILVIRSGIDAQCHGKIESPT